MHRFADQKLEQDVERRIWPTEGQRIRGLNPVRRSQGIKPGRQNVKANERASKHLGAILTTEKGGGIGVQKSLFGRTKRSESKGSPSSKKTKGGSATMRKRVGRRLPGPKAWVLRGPI